MHKRIEDADVAAIAIGACAPMGFMKNSHMYPEEAVQTQINVKASLIQRQLLLERFQTLTHGQTLSYGTLAGSIKCETT